jgi:hypothetical protein
MNKEAENNPQQQKQQPGKQDPTGSVNTSDDSETKPFTGESEPKQRSTEHFQEEPITRHRLSARRSRDARN